MSRLPFGIALLALGLGASVLAQEPRPAPDRKELAQRAQKAFDAQNWEEAVAGYRELVKVDDGDATAWHHLGYALHVLARLDEAIEAHLKAATFPRTRSSGLYNAGCAYALKKDADQAFKFLNDAVAAGFGDARTLANDTDLAALHGDPRWEKLAAAVKAVGEKLQPIAYASDRRSSRVFWFGKERMPGQVVLTYGPVAWKAEYAEAIKSPKLEGRRWRFGKDFWTTIDASTDVTFGPTKVPAGYYYLTLERRKGGEFVLAFNDATAIRKAKLDAFQAAQTTGGIEVVMRHDSLAEPLGELDITLSIDEGDAAKGALTIRFGPNKLSVPAIYHLSE